MLHVLPPAYKPSTWKAGVRGWPAIATQQYPVSKKGVKGYVVTTTFNSQYSGERGRGGDHWVWGQLGLKIKFKASQDYIQTPCLKKKNKTKTFSIPSPHSRQSTRVRKVFVKQGALPGLSEARFLERRGGGREKVRGREKNSILESIEEAFILHGNW